jgi:ferredoxin
MIITKQKEFSDILKFLEGEESIFIIGCGECSTTCKTGGEKEVLEIKSALQQKGFKITGYYIPEAPCIASQVRIALAKNKKKIIEADSILVLACGLGAQSIKDNLFSDKVLHVGCDTLFMGQVDKEGAFLERCSGCGDCVLELTDMICPVTRCAKGLVNGPCGGQDKGKCEVDKDKDCAWILIYEALKKKNKVHLLKEIRPPKDYSKIIKPRSKII